MAKASSPAASITVVAALSLLGIGICFPVDSVRADNADNCVAAPNASAPQGQHWYYRVDRATHRKCWYLHATIRLPHHATAQPADTPAESAAAGPVAQPPSAPAEPTKTVSAPPPSAEPAPRPTANAPTSESNTDNPQPAPHVTVLTVRTVSTPFVDTAPTTPQHTPENVNTPPMPQTVPGEEKTAGNNVKPVAGAARAPLPPVPEAVRHELAKTIDAANAGKRTGPAEMFLLLALALGIVTIAIVIASKMAGRHNAPRLSDDPDTVWMRYRAAHQRSHEEAAYEEQDVPFVDPQHGLADLHEQEWGDQPPPEQAEYPPARSQDGDPAPAEAAAPSLKDIELALRILRQARQSRVA
jgi:hypothetical protein